MMENSNQKIVPMPTQTSQDTSKIETIVALNTLDNMYKENIKSYADTLYEYTQKIDDSNSKLEALKKEMLPHELVLGNIAKEIDYELRTLERFTQEWCEANLIVDALKSELGQLNNSEEEREGVLKNRYATVKKVQKEIDTTELALLKHALEEQNVLLVAEPITREIEALELHIKKLESKKRYIETAHLHHITPQGESNNMMQLEDRSEIIDV